MARRSTDHAARAQTKSHKDRHEQAAVSEDLSDDGLELSSQPDENEDEDEGVAQWAPDDWDGEDDEDSDIDASEDADDDQSDDSGDDDGDDTPDLSRLQKDLQSLPLATLMKAQKSMKTREPTSSDDETAEAGGGPSTIRAKRLAEAKAKLAEMQRRKGKASAVPALSEDDDGSEDEFADLRAKKGGGHVRDEGPAKERVKRDNKHAPTAMSTKKQVSRNRQVIDVGGKNDRRDPRFDSLSTSTVQPHIQSTSYSFLPQMLKDELAGLRTAVKMAQKAEAHCPWAEKPARTAEREMLELQLGRLRTKIERGEREAREREVLAKFKKQENEKRGQGKGAWYLKKSEQKDLLLKARFENLEKKGGKTAVKKALEKKRKKVAGKEKKSRPFAQGSQGGSDGKRRRTA